MGYWKYLKACVAVVAILYFANGAFAVDNRVPKGLKQGAKCTSNSQCDPIYIKGLKCVQKKCQCPENVFWDEVEDQCVWQTYMDECKPNKNKKDPAGNCEYGLKCVMGYCKCLHTNSDLCDGRVLEGLVHMRSAGHIRERAGSAAPNGTKDNNKKSGTTNLNFNLAVLIASICFGFLAMTRFEV